MAIKHVLVSDNTDTKSANGYLPSVTGHGTQFDYLPSFQEWDDKPRNLAMVMIIVYLLPGTVYLLPGTVYLLSGTVSVEIRHIPRLRHVKSAAASQIM